MKTLMCILCLCFTFQKAIPQASFTIERERKPSYKKPLTLEQEYEQERNGQRMLKHYIEYEQHFEHLCHISGAGFPDYTIAKEVLNYEQIICDDFGGVEIHGLNQYETMLRPYKYLQPTLQGYNVYIFFKNKELPVLLRRIKWSTK